MRVCLLAYESNKSKGTGIQKYCAIVFEYLKRRDIEVELIESKNNESPILFDNLVLPFSVLKKIGSNCVFHALSPNQGIYLPYFTKKSVVTFHDIASMREIEIEDAKHSFLYYLYGNFVYNSSKKANHIIAVSTQTKKELEEKLKIPSKKITIINHGIENKFKVLRKKKNDKLPTIGYLGCLTKRKRVHILLRSFKIFQSSYPEINCRLKIYGIKNVRGLKSEYFNLIELEKKLKIKNVYFRGFVPENKLVDVYNSFDVFVFPTVYEGFGMPILEAQRCGVPVITMKDAKIPEEVKKETIQCEDEEDIAEKIYILLNDKKFRNKIIKKGLDYSKRFTWENCIDKMIRVYEKIES